MKMNESGKPISKNKRGRFDIIIDILEVAKKGRTMLEKAKEITLQLQ